MYYVIKQEKCSNCDGAGKNPHPDWIAYWGGNPTWLLTQQFTDRWFQERGYDVPPPEEVECVQCKGSGIVESEVMLSEALRDLGFWQLVQLPEVTK